MKKLFTFFVILALLANVSFLVSCNSNEPKKIAKEDQDFSSSGLIKEMEEMNKAAEKNKPAAQPQPPAPQPEPKK